jgi:hypothetical protein
LRKALIVFRLTPHALVQTFLAKLFVVLGRCVPQELLFVLGRLGNVSLTVVLDGQHDHNIEADDKGDSEQLLPGDVDI